MPADLKGPVRLLLRLILDPDDRAQVEMDLSEERRALVAPRFGHGLASAWLLVMATRSAVAWWRARLRVWAEGLGQDLLSSFRGLRRSPRLSATALASIALGVGATGAVLTLFVSALLRPLPFPEADRLVRVWNDELGGNPRGGLAWADVHDVGAEMRSLDAFVATSRARLTVVGTEGARRAQGEGVTPGYFELLGVNPALGRLFSASDHSASSEPAIILTFDAWQQQFGGDPSVLGATIATTTKDFTVIGVAEAGFRGTLENDLPDHEFWIPMEQAFSAGDLERRGRGNVWTIGRLARGATLARVETELAAIDARLRIRFPEARVARTLRVEALGESWRSQLRVRNRLLLLAATLLLLVATSNVAGLLIARTVSRAPELATRSALGSGRGRLVRLVAAEAAVLSVGGGVLGLLMTRPILQGFLRLSPVGLPTYVRVHPDAAAVGLSLAAVGATCVLTAAATAALATRVDVGHVLRADGRGATMGRAARRGGEWIITAEVALTVVLAVAGGLLARSFAAESGADLGYRTERLLRMAMTIDERDVPDETRMPDFLDGLRSAVSTYPGVARVGLSWQALPPGYEVSQRVHFDGMPPSFASDGVPVGFHAVDPELLPALEVELSAGRYVSTEDEAEGRRIVIVCGSLAEMMGGPDAAIGRTLEYRGEAYDVVGVVSDVMYQGPVKRRTRDLDIYVALAQHSGRTISIAIQTETEPLEYVEPLGRRLGALAPSSAQHWISSMSAEIEDDLGGPFFYVVLLAAFALSALALTAVGLFAVVEYQVARQRSELGVRRAIGATPARILAVVGWRGLRPAMVGVSVGALASVPVGRLLAATLYGVPAIDWTTLAASAAVVLSVSAWAAAVCAVRVWRVGPAEVLARR